MNLIFESLPTLQLKAAILMITLVLGSLLLKRMSARWQSWYWRLAAVTLLGLFLAECTLTWSPAALTKPPVNVTPETTAMIVAPEFGAAEASVAAETSTVSRNINWTQLFAWIWIAGVALFGLHVLLGRIAIGLRRLRSKPANADNWSNDLRIPVRFLEDVRAPFVGGALNPTIYLPPEAETWDEATRLAVLTHELSHVRRGDAWFGLLMELCRILFWLNPLVHIAARQLRIAEERATDDAVLGSGAEASRYAELLLSFARAAQGPRPFFAVRAMAQPSTVGERIRKILDPTQNRARPSLRWFAPIALVLCGCGIVLGSLTAAQAPAAAEIPEPVVAADDEDDDPNLYTQVYKIDPRWLGEGRGAPKTKLEAMGVGFPPGAAVIFNPTTRQLIVRNTKKNLAKIEAWFDQKQKGAIDASKPLRYEIRIFALGVDRANQIATSPNASGFQQLQAAEEAVSAGDGRFVSEQTLVARANRSSAFVTGRPIYYTADWKDVNGRDRPVEESAIHGTKVEVSGALADGRQDRIAATVFVTHGAGTPRLVESEIKAPASGEMRKVSQVVGLETSTIRGDLILDVGQTALAGMMKGEASDESILVFMTAGVGK